MPLEGVHDCAQEPYHEQDQGDDERDVNQPASGEPGGETQEPESEKNDRDNQDYGHAKLLSFVGLTHFAAHRIGPGSSFLSGMLENCGSKMQSWNDGPEAHDDQVDAHHVAQEPGIDKDENSENKGDDAPDQTNRLKHGIYRPFPLPAAAVLILARIGDLSRHNIPVVFAPTSARGIA
jgi:hypothetical protein